MKLKTLSIFIALAFMCMGTSAQIFDGVYFTPIKSPYAYDKMRFMKQLVPPEDTISVKKGIALIDTSFYIGNGTNWRKVQGGVGGGLDSIAVNTTRRFGSLDLNAWRKTTNESSQELVTDILDSYTGEPVAVTKATTFQGVTLNDSHVDSSIILKNGSDYYVRSFTGDIPAAWYGVVGDGATNVKTGLQKLITAGQTFHKKVILPSAPGTYRVVGKLTIASGTLLSFDNGAILQADTIQGGYIQALPTQQIFSNNPVLIDVRTTGTMWYPEQWGAVGDSTTDCTTAFQRCFAAAAKLPQATVVLTGKYLITGAVTLTYPANMNVKFERNSMITGNGSFGNGGVIEAPYDQQIWGDSLTVQFYTTNNRDHSVKWFGAKGNGVTDDWYALQKAANLNKQYSFDGKSWLYFPLGTYIITKPILLFNWNGTSYTPVSAAWRSERSTQHGISARALIKAQGAAMGRQMLLAIQIGYQCHFENIAFEGLYTKPTTISVGNFRNLVNSSYSDWQQDGISDKKFAPHACVVFDPFIGTVPADTGYTDLAMYYRGATSSGGSSNNEFKGCWFSSTPVGTLIGLAPGFGQSEYNRFIDCSWENMKIGYATGNSQSNNCIIYNFEAVGWMHHFVDNISYGSSSAGSPPFIDKGVVAQGMIYFAAISSAGKPLHVNQVFCETIYKVGIFNNIDGGYSGISSISNSTFNLYRYDEIKSADWINLGKVNFVNTDVILVASGNSRPHRLKLAVKNSDATFTNGLVSQVITKVPAVRSPTQGSYQKIAMPTFNNVGTYLPTVKSQVNKATQNAYLQSILNLPVGFTKLKWEEVAGIDYEFNWNQPFLDETIYLMNGRSVVVDSTGYSYVKLDTTQVKKINVGDVLTTDLSAGLSYSQVIPELTPGNANVMIDEMPVLGLVTSISNDTVFMVGASRNLSNGTTSVGNVYLNYRRELNDILVYNSTNSSTVLDSVERYVPQATGQFSFPAAGARIEGPGIVPGTKVVSSNSSAKTITLSIAANATTVNSTSVNGSPEVSVTSTYSPKQAAALGTPAFFINGMKWRWKTKDTANKEMYYDYIIGNTAFKNQYYTAATRVLDTARVVQINPIDVRASKSGDSIIVNVGGTRTAIFDRSVDNMKVGYPIVPTSSTAYDSSIALYVDRTAKRVDILSLRVGTSVAPVTITNTSLDLQIGNSSATAKFRLLPYLTDIYIDNTITGKTYFRNNANGSVLQMAMFETNGYLKLGTSGTPGARLHVGGHARIDSLLSGVIGTDSIVVHDASTKALKQIAATTFNKSSSGSGAPSGGNDGDLYIDTSTGQWYRKSSGTWSVIYTPTGGGGSSLIGTIDY